MKRNEEKNYDLNQFYFWTVVRASIESSLKHGIPKGLIFMGDEKEEERSFTLQTDDIIFTATPRCMARMDQ